MNLDIPIVYIVSTGRNGSIFLQSLLDGHPEILMISRTFFYNDFYRKYVTDDKEELIDRFIRHFPTFFSVGGELDHKYDFLGDDKDEVVFVSKRKFRKKLTELLTKYDEVTEKLFFYAVHFSYEFARNGDEGFNKKVIIHHIHHVNQLLSVNYLSPNSKVISMSRDPRVTAQSSYINQSRSFGFCKVRYYYKAFIRSFEDIYLLEQKKENYDCRVLRLEDLHLYQDKILLEVCKFIGIDFHSVMMESTMYGHMWWGDRISGRDLNGFNKNMGKVEWSSFYKNSDLKLLGYFLRNRLENYNYDLKVQPYSKIQAYIALLLPMKFELEYIREGGCSNVSGGNLMFRLWNITKEGIFFRYRLLKRDRLVNKPYLFLQMITCD
jgi:hypothetical protein